MLSLPIEAVVKEARQVVRDEGDHRRRTASRRPTRSRSQVGARNDREIEIVSGIDGGRQGADQARLGGRERIQDVSGDVVRVPPHRAQGPARAQVPLAPDGAAASPSAPSPSCVMSSLAESGLATLFARHRGARRRAAHRHRPQEARARRGQAGQLHARPHRRRIAICSSRALPHVVEHSMFAALGRKDDGRRHRAAHAHRSSSPPTAASSASCTHASSPRGASSPTRRTAQHAKVCVVGAQGRQEALGRRRASATGSTLDGIRCRVIGQAGRSRSLGHRLRLRLARLRGRAARDARRRRSDRRKAAAQLLVKTDDAQSQRHRQAHRQRAARRRATTASTTSRSSTSSRFMDEVPPGLRASWRPSSASSPASRCSSAASA